MSRRVLLLHPEDAFPQSGPADGWDLVVDLGRAPLAAYQRWTRQGGCEVFSLYRFAREIDDLGRLRELLQLGLGRMVDRSGIDWWDLLCLFIAGDLQQLMLVHRLSKELGAGCELYASRSYPLATALQRLLGARLTILESRFQSVIRRARHSHNVLSHLDTAQLAQVLQDKFDTGHSIRRRFARRGQTSKQPVILLPSAYINVSRTALSYAELLRDHQFLLVLARSNGKLTSLPPNVRSTSVAPYFVPINKPETASLLDSWESLRKRLVCGAEEFNTADAVGVLGKIPALLPWGIALRDAWTQVFESENVTACLSADDSNPPSSIPLLMAKKRGLPALACHHGALDYQLAIKANHADFYVVKSEMEQDYLRRICHLAPEKIVIAGPASSKPLPLQGLAGRSAPWLVFFTEPYQSYGWRSDEVYRDLLSRLRSLAQTCGLRLVFKLHPFESIKGHRKMLRRLIPEHEKEIDVIAGPPSDQLWDNTQFALTVQSSTALECAALGIPVFLCAWLRDCYSGYVQQYARFGAGQVLESPEQIDEIPRLLERQNGRSLQSQASRRIVNGDKLADLFSGAYSLPVASNVQRLLRVGSTKYIEL
jgi:hypothetical protein